MKLLLDENLSRRIIPLIESHYPGSSQIALLKLERASDCNIWMYARENHFVVVTKDSDFIDLSAFYGSPPKLILLKTGNQSWQSTAKILIENCEKLTKTLSASDVTCLDF